MVELILKDFMVDIDKTIDIKALYSAFFIDFIYGFVL